MTLEVSREVYTEERSDAHTVGEWRPFLVVAGFVVLALMASSTPTPLYTIYAAEWGFSALSVTEVYAVYAIGVLLALLLTGGLSDAIGRRPVIVSALLGLVGAELVFDGRPAGSSGCTSPAPFRVSQPGCCWVPPERRWSTSTRDATAVRRAS